MPLSPYENPPATAESVRYTTEYYPPVTTLLDTVLITSVIFLGALGLPATAAAVYGTEIVHCYIDSFLVHGPEENWRRTVEQRLDYLARGGVLVAVGGGYALPERVP